MCKYHENQIDEEKQEQEQSNETPNNNNNNTNDEYFINDGTQKKFDVKRCLQQFDTQYKLQGELEKTNAANILCNAISKITKANKDLIKGINGAIELRMYTPTFHMCTLRNNSNENKLNKLKREKLYQSNAWCDLLNELESIQNERNKKKEIKDKNGKNKINDNADMTVNMDHLNTKVNELKYDNDTDKTEIVDRIQQCVKEVKQGRFKRGMDRLNDTKIVNLNDITLWQITQSKFPRAKRINKDSENHKNNSCKGYDPPLISRSTSNFVW